jgi:alanyl-tRNA synthetase
MSSYNKLDEQKKFACRVIADHARATAFSIADGILPGNEGRNYVIRKIMRRAIYQGRHTLGFERMFFHKVTNFVIDQMGEAYPELEAHREFIDKMVRLEEERFGSTLTVGLKKLEELFAKSTPATVPDYKDLARLYDTFGTPRDLMRVVLEERGYQISEEEFNRKLDNWIKELHETTVGQVIRSTLKQQGIEEMSEVEIVFKDGTVKIASDDDDPILKTPESYVDHVRFKQSARAAATGKHHSKSSPIYAEIASRMQSLFRGYETTRIDDAKVLALISGGEEVQTLIAGDEGEVTVDQTPFYAESGGQVGDVGTLINPPVHAGGTALIAHVLDTYSPAHGLIVHKVKIDKGSVQVGDTVTAEVDIEKRDATRRNHTATHLVHAALREVLGTHVKQAGSIVAPNYLRFDFTHYQPMTEEEVKEVERLVNEQILRNVKVETDIMPVEEAIRSGAMALFGEKYSGLMRVLTVPGFSKELCGGTHVRATGDIGVFKITSDESIASGVRRIRAITGFDAYERFREDERLIEEAAANLRTSRAELPQVIGRLQEELKKARREADDLKLKIATGAISSSASNGDDARDIAGVRVLAKEASGLDAAGMRQLSDTLLDRIKSGVVVLGRTNDGKASLIVRTSNDLLKKVPAGQVIKELAPIIGGRGGGKADMAEGGGSQPEKLGEALQASYGVIEKMLS